MNRDDIMKIIAGCQVQDAGIQILQCGSSIDNPAARDIDIIVYTCKDLHGCYIELLSQFESKCMIKKSYIDIWNMYSFKFEENHKIISFHIVSFEDLKKHVARAGEVEIYANINLFSLSLKLPTVYRKWINDTIHLCGDNSLKMQLEFLLGQYQMPVAAIKDLLKKRIFNSINYYFEKKGSDLFSGIVIAQIFNDIVLYCYAGNNKFYGTLKYVEGDLETFENCVELSRESIGLFQSMNREEECSIVKRLHNIQELLYQF